MNQNTHFTKKSLLATLTPLALSFILFGCQSLSAPNQTLTTNTHSSLTHHSINNNAAAQSQTNQSQANQSTNRLYRETLSNGLKVIIKEDKRTPIVMTQIWYNVGSNDEPTGLGGLSHFLEHLMFKDNILITSDEYHRLISHFGGQNNAFTAYDYTVYYESLPANQYPVALQIEAARMNGLLFNDNEIATEKQVVQEERRLRVDDDPFTKAYEFFNAKSLPDSPKSRPIIGSMQDINALNGDALKNWYDTWYHPNNATLVLVGDLNANDAMTWVKKYFNAIPSKTLPKRPSLSQPSHRGYQSHRTHQDIQVPKLIMGFNVPTLVSANKKQDAYALSMISDIADGGLSARFEQQLVRNKHLVSNIYVEYSMFGKGDDVFTIVATPNEGVSLEDVEQAILDELSLIGTGTIEDDEITRGQNNLVASLIFANDSLTAQAQTLGMLASLALPLDTLEQLPKQLALLDKNTIQQTARHYLNKDNLTTVYVLPTHKTTN